MSLCPWSAVSMKISWAWSSWPVSSLRSLQDLQGVRVQAWPCHRAHHWFTVVIALHEEGMISSIFFSMHLLVIHNMFALGVPFLVWSTGSLKEVFSFCLSFPGVLSFCAPWSFTLGVVCGVVLNGFSPPVWDFRSWHSLRVVRVYLACWLPPMYSLWLSLYLLIINKNILVPFLMQSMSFLLRIEDVDTDEKRVCEGLQLKRVYRLLHIRVGSNWISLSCFHNVLDEFGPLIALELSGRVVLNHI